MRSKIKHIKAIILNLALLSIMPSCKTTNNLPIVVIEEPVSPYASYTKAIVIKYSLDGCNWMLQLEDGKKLEPRNLKDEFKKENLKVWVTYQTFNDYSFCMAGDIINIEDIALREE